MVGGVEARESGCKRNTRGSVREWTVALEAIFNGISPCSYLPTIMWRVCDFKECSMCTLVSSSSLGVVISSKHLPHLSRNANKN